MATKTVEYKQGDRKLRGLLAHDEALRGERPGIVVFHEWWGCNAFARKRAELLADHGYVALAADLYGEGAQATDRETAAKWCGELFADRKVLLARAQAGLDALLSSGLVDSQRTAAIGFCMGGTTALQLALAGADLAAAVSFHGGLAGVAADPQGRCKAALLVLHGADDPFITPSDIAAFQESLRKAQLDWQMVYYGSALHSFTNPDAKGQVPGAVHHQLSDQRSWQHMRMFFDERFGK